MTVYKLHNKLLFFIVFFSITYKYNQKHRLVTKHFFFCWTITIQGQIKSDWFRTKVNCLSLRLILLKKFLF